MTTDKPVSLDTHPRLLRLLKFLECSQLACVTEKQLLRIVCDPSSPNAGVRKTKNLQRAARHHVEHLILHGRIKRTTVESHEPNGFPDKPLLFGPVTSDIDWEKVKRAALAPVAAILTFAKAGQELPLNRFSVFHVHDLPPLTQLHLPFIVSEVLSLIHQAAPSVASSWMTSGRLIRELPDSRYYHLGTVQRGDHASAVLFVEPRHDDSDLSDSIRDFCTELSETSTFNALIFGDSDAGKEPRFEVW